MWKNHKKREETFISFMLKGGVIKSVNPFLFHP